MKKIAVPTAEQVSAESQAIFEQLQKRLGKVPNLYATVGYSANALKGFLEFDATLSKGAFNAKERESIALAVSEVNRCEYCLAAHTMLAIKNGLTTDDTLAVRRGQVADARLNAIVQLAKSIAETKGKPGEGLVDNFFNAGLDEAALMELIGLVTVRIFTNYVFAITNVPVDFPAAQVL
ncbi:carboxymuconolactone decarboxylase family protein [Mucilaginibacter agri]|uniref:Carboxymuconolactone decarboxylase family protein n=1 Tax=Mucilaginibacter agri TaxID=2695265 RepID=A0A966DSM2_9SPHI|nr:carboxymuconolactone decarboxylase family protein [Mucilaginibacter agri]NCD69760.1 carboxymuconolactone decarboxylase family protein [Mucilaginibacter agri]